MYIIDILYFVVYSVKMVDTSDFYFNCKIKQRELYVQPCSHLYQPSLLNKPRSMKYQLRTWEMTSCWKFKMLDI